MAEEIVKLGQLKGGESLLDLATGTGIIARTAAQTKVSVFGIDISLGMLARARTLSAGEIPFLVGDAHTLPFVDQYFDLVTCGFSLSHFSDVSSALGEIFRVLRSNGRFITSAWGTEGETPSKAAAIKVRRRYLEDREVTFEGEFGEEAWSNTERGCETLRLAGFSDVQVTTQHVSGEYRSSSEAIEAALAWPITLHRISKLAPADQQRLKEDTAAAILEVDDLRWLSQIHTYQAIRPERVGSLK